MFKGSGKDKPKDKETKGKESKKELKDKKVQESDTEDSSSGMCGIFGLIVRTGRVKRFEVCLCD